MINDAGAHLVSFAIPVSVYCDGLHSRNYTVQTASSTLTIINDVYTLMENTILYDARECYHKRNVYTLTSRAIGRRLVHQ